jgi:AcrR family transcriptional regulator
MNRFTKTHNTTRRMAMPKIIENIREELLAETKRQIGDRGYSNTTIRSVADACGIGVGTVYNYFPTKDILVATAVSLDWQVELDKMASLPNNDPKLLFGGIFDSLRDFANKNRSLFSDVDVTQVVSSTYSTHHKFLRKQIANCIVPLCQTYELENIEFTAEFLAEVLICWSIENRSFDEVYGVIRKIFTV